MSDDCVFGEFRPWLKYCRYAAGGGSTADLGDCRMHRVVLAVSLSVLIIAGAAAAQPGTRSGPVYGHQDPQPDAGPYSYPPDLNVKIRPDTTVVHQASEQFRLACAADRETFCKDRTRTEDVLWCIKLRRSKLTGSCRSAWDKLVMASEGRL